MSDKTVPTLDYAKVTDRPYSADRARVVKRISMLPAAIGLLILLTYACSGVGVLINCGIYWFLWGGLFTLANFIAAVVLYVLTRLHGKTSRTAGEEYRTSAVISLATVPFAIFCVVTGMILANLWNGDDWT